MSKKRKDKKGRVLRKGESQRKDLMYQYRFTDSDGTRKMVYASTLDGLREKEAEIDAALGKNITYHPLQTSVLELVQKYLSLQINLRPSTMNLKNSIVNLLVKEGNEGFAHQPINRIKSSDAKAWYIRLNRKGMKRGTIGNIHSLLRCSFQMAYEEDIIEKNPFKFSLSFLPDDSTHRKALTYQQQHSFFEFMQSDAVVHRYYDIYYILLWTGLRIGELCGLTIHDLDFEHRLICVDHQLIRDKDGNYRIGPPKTQSGIRKVLMTDEVSDAFKRIIEQRDVKIEKWVDGKTGFLFVNRRGNPRYAQEMDRLTQRIMSRYNKSHPNSQLLNVTPHVFRHTFCTNMANAGMRLKDLQYMMGHATADMTMNLYSHVDAEHAIAEMKDVVYRLKQEDAAAHSSEL